MRQHDLSFPLPYSLHLPLLNSRTIKVVGPVTDAELLVEGRVIGAHVRNTTSILVTHMEDLTVELLVGVETNSLVSAVEGKGYVRELLPSLGL